jgi:VWFA-related protein
MARNEATTAGGTPRAGVCVTVRRVRAFGVAVAMAMGGWASGLEAVVQTDPVQAPPIFRSGVDLVSVSAVVRDRKGRVVRNLSKADFVVSDGAEVRPIVDFSANELGPASLALLFDVSGSMEGKTKIDAARRAAGYVLSWLQPGVDEAAVFTFDSRLQEVQGFTSELGPLREALRTFKPFGATSLYDAIAETARRVDVRTNKRRGILVLTDGVDTNSRLTPAAVSAIANSIDMPVYLFEVVSPLDHPGGRDSVVSATASASAGALSDLARWTGGDLFVMSTPSQASLAAGQLLSELRHQYLIAFEPAPEAGWHRLDIRTRDSGWSVRTRSGYISGKREPWPTLRAPEHE